MRGEVLDLFGRELEGVCVCSWGRRGIAVNTVGPATLLTSNLLSKFAESCQDLYALLGEDILRDLAHFEVSLHLEVCEDNSSHEK